jgi:hypothetical protein
MIKYTPQLLKKIEEIFEENGYKVRFEKGNFKSGFCIMEDRKIVVINKFAAVESRINTMLEILKIIGQNTELTGDKYAQVHKMMLKQQSVEESTE